MFFPLLILTLISATGLLLYTTKKLPSRLLSLFIALGAGSMLAVSLVHILPEALEQTENAIYAFIAGFLLIYLVEEFIAPHSHDHAHHDHHHEDPHEHFDHVVLVSFIAIFLHTLFDGLGIRAGMGLSETIGYAVLFGVAIHQIPVSLSLAAIFRESNFRRSTQILFMVAFSFAAAIGYIISDFFLANVGREMAGLAAAFAGGSLLYVSAVDLLPFIHDQGKRKFPAVVMFIIGCIVMTGVKVFEGEHGHHAGESPEEHALHAGEHNE